MIPSCAAGMARRRGVRGFTLFEVAVATMVVVVLSVLLLERVQTFRQEAERVATQRLVASLRTALSVRIAQRSVAKMEQGLLSVTDENPIDWLAQPPENYLGEYYAPEEGSLPDRAWYFDTGRKELVYITSEAKSFGRRKQILLRFKVKSVYLPLQRGKTPGPPAVIKGAVLDQVTEKNVDK